MTKIPRPATNRRPRRGSPHAPAAPSAVEIPDVRRCFSYLPGHTTHYIPAIRVHVRTPQDPIEVSNVTAGGWIAFRDQEGPGIRWWNHDAPRMLALWRAGARFARVRGTTFLVARVTEASARWLYCDDAPSPCIDRPSTGPVEALTNEGGFVMTLGDPKAEPPCGVN